MSSVYRKTRFRALHIALLAGSALTIGSVTVSPVLAQAVTNLSGSTDMTISNAQTLTDTQTANTTYSGALTGPGGFEVDGAAPATLILSGTNTYSGGTLLNGGTIQGSTSSLQGNFSLTGEASQTQGNFTTTVPATLSFTQGFNGNFGGSISGTGQVLIDLTSTGSSYEGGPSHPTGTLTLTGASNFSGPLTVQEGTLSFGSGASLAPGTNLVLEAGGSLDLGSQDLTLGSLLVAAAPYTPSLSGGNIYLGTHTLTLSNGYITGSIQGGGSVVVQGDGVGLAGNNGFSALIINNSQVTLSSRQEDEICYDYCSPQYANGSLGSQTSVAVNGNSVFELADNSLNQTISNLTGTGTVKIDQGNSLTVFPTGNETFGGSFAGVGSLAIAGSSTLSLITASTLSGPVTVYGTVQAADAHALGSGTIFLSSSGTIENAGENLTLGGIADVSSYDPGGNIVMTGVTQLTIGSNNADTAFSGSISGSGATLAKVGSGTLTLSGNSTYGGGTTVSAGTLAISSATAISDGAGNSITFNGGALRVLDSMNLASNIQLSMPGAVDTAGNQLVLGGIISGTGSLTKTGAGTLTLSNAANTYRGGTIVNAGALAITANNAAGTGALTVASGATFAQTIYDQTVSGLSGSGTITSTGGVLINTGVSRFTGRIASTAALNQPTGSGQILDGNSTFSSTSLAGGTLEVGDVNSPNATLTSPVTISSGGVLAGHGTIVGNVMNNNGTVSPGGTIGTLSVIGNYTQSPMSTLAIEVSPIAASKLAVTGTANLAGALTLTADAGTYTKGTTYQIVSANGVSGNFSTVTESGQAVPFSELYTPNAVDLVVGSTGTTFAMGNTTPNEANALGAIQSILPATSAGAFQAGLTSLGLATGTHSPQLAGALGELRADLASVDLANLTSFQNFLVERMDRRQGLTSTMEVNTGLPGTFDVAQNGTSDQALFGPGSVLADDQPSFWVHGYGVLGTLGDETGYAEAQYRTSGIVGGADLKVTDTTLLGAAVAYEHTDLNLSGDTDENTIDTYRVSLYGSQKLDPIGVPLTLDAAFGYAFNDYYDNDFLPLAGSGFSQTSRHDGNELTAETGLSQDVHIKQDLVPGALTLVPRIGVEYDNISQNPYTTTGAPAGGLNLATNGSTLSALRSTIGARADLKLVTNDGTVVTPELRATYLHDFMDTNVALTEVFAGAPAAGFKVSGVHPGREAALVGTGVSVGFSENISATIGYDAAVRDRELDHTVQIGVKYKW